MVERAGLENQYGLMVIGGSNPPLSADCEDEEVRSPRCLYCSAFGLVKSRFEKTEISMKFLSKENAKILKNKN